MAAKLVVEMREAVSFCSALLAAEKWDKECSPEKELYHCASAVTWAATLLAAKQEVAGGHGRMGRRLMESSSRLQTIALGESCGATRPASLETG